MSKYEAKVEAIRKRIPQPEKQINIVTVFSDGKRARGMGRGELLTEEEYRKMNATGQVILIEWSEPYEVDDDKAGEKRPGDCGGDKESESGPVQDSQGIEDDSPELLSIVERIRARRGEKGNDGGAHA